RGTLRGPRQRSLDARARRGDGRGRAVHLARRPWGARIPLLYAEPAQSDARGVPAPGPEAPGRSAGRTRQRLTGHPPGSMRAVVQPPPSAVTSETFASMRLCIRLIAVCWLLSELVWAVMTAV